MSQAGFDMFRNCGEYEWAAAIFFGALSDPSQPAFREVHEDG